MIINGPATANYDIDLGALPITDWFHTSIFTVNAAAVHANGPPTADNVLVNGSMTSTYGGKYAETTLTPGKAHLLRFINVGINNYLHVGLDGHKFTVISADYTPIVPYETDSIVLAVGKFYIVSYAITNLLCPRVSPTPRICILPCNLTLTQTPGQRYDVIIAANATLSNYWLRIGTGGRCDGPNANAANIRSIFRYAGAGSGEPNSISKAPLPGGCYDENNVVPYAKTEVPRDTPKSLEVGFTDTGMC
jgi:FtsP/CotA-like multicopper oxidase with cupredoxin domain